MDIAAPKFNATRRTILSLDLDNTVYDFVSFYAKAFRAMAAVVSKQLRLDRIEVEKEFRDVYRRAGTLDFRDLVQNLPLSQHLEESARSRLVTQVRRAYDLSKRKQLKSYDYMIPTLRAMEAAGVILIVVTNAPAYHAYKRIHDVGALPYVHGLVAWEGQTTLKDGSNEDKYILHTHKLVLARARRNLPFLAMFEKQRSKPDPHPFELIVNRFGDANYFAVGDSLSKDLLPAAKIGMKTIWARYGTIMHDEKDMITLLSITPWSKEEVSIHLEQAFSPDYIIDDPRQLLDILPHYDQLSLFGDRA